MSSNFMGSGATWDGLGLTQDLVGLQTCSVALRPLGRFSLPLGRTQVSVSVHPQHRPDSGDVRRLEASFLECV